MILFFIILFAWGSGHEVGENIIYTTSEVVNDIGNDVFFEIIEPAELAFTYRLRPALDFGSPFNASLSKGNIALVPTQPLTSCTEPTNADMLKGKVALIQRGGCTFYLKTAMAQRVGAVAAIISDYPSSMEKDRDSPIWRDHYYEDMIMGAEVDGEVSEDVNIPAGFLLGKNGRIIRETLSNLGLPFAIINIPVNLTLTGFRDHREPPWVLF